MARASAPRPTAALTGLAAFALLAALPSGAAADTVIAARTLLPGAAIGPADVTLQAGAAVPGALTDPAAAIGQEARRILYAGQPLHAADLGPPTVIDRNEIVTLSYRAGALRIVTEARALARAGVGDRIDVMNLASRNRVTGTVTGPGRVRAGPTDPAS